MKLLNMGTALRSRVFSHAPWFSWLGAHDYLCCPMIFLWKAGKDGDSVSGNVFIFLTVKKTWIWILFTWILPVWHPPRKETGLKDVRNSVMKNSLWRSIGFQCLSQQTDAATPPWTESVFYCRTYFHDRKGNCDGRKAVRCQWGRTRVWNDGTPGLKQRW